MTPENIATEQVLEGKPGRAARPWLLTVSIVAAVLFAVNTLLVLNHLTSAFDLRLEVLAQSIPWGPLVPVMNFTNRTGGLVQDAAGAAVVIGMLIFERRAGLLMAFGAGGSLLAQFFKVALGRHRPGIDVVKVLDPSNGYSYPSGHAVFFTWIAVMLAISLLPHLSRTWRIVAWMLAALLIFVGALGRVWAGAHWPSDVTGGIFLAISWCAFVLWFPERFFPRAQAVPDRVAGPDKRVHKAA
ncbi:MAG TPA: phosphatase PAP2 family protein [Candidatus Dormibacteraeota bacterium]|nr:phosphatase PAP2 family protein [Candidatus Dormibacteraeota bacterium]